MLPLGSFSGQADPDKFHANAEGVILGIISRF
jgi:hypothetical protein